MTYTYTRTERMRKRDFRNVRWRKNAESVHFIFSSTMKNTGERRFAVITPKKLGKASVRNRAKRVIREFFRLHKELFREGYNHLIRVKKIPEGLSFHKISPELSRLAASCPKP